MVSDLKSVAGTWQGVVYEPGSEPDNVELTIREDGSYDLVTDGNLLVFFLGADQPSHELLLVTGRSLLHGDASGAKTLVSNVGTTENLCQTLS